MERGRVHPVDLSVEAPLPAYDGGPGGAPPSYQSIVEKIHDANETSSTPVHFLYRVTKILLNTAAVTAVLFLLLAVPVAMIVMGALYKDDCPVEPNIPIYLIVTASFSILKCLVDMILRCIKLHQEGDSNEQKSTTEKIFSFVILCFLSVFFIVGNVWVYSNYPPSDIVSDPNYCYGPLYYFAFWFMTSCYILLGVFFCLECCLICVAVCKDP